MTDELCVKAKEMLERHGFKDVQSEHPWNMIQMERKLGKLGHLVVWGREWSAALFQWVQDEECRVSIIDTDDLGQLESAVAATVTYLNAIKAVLEAVKS